MRHGLPLAVGLALMPQPTAASSTPVPWHLAEQDTPVIRVQALLDRGWADQEDPAAAYVAAALIGDARETLDPLGAAMATRFSAHQGQIDIDLLAGSEDDVLAAVHAALKTPDLTRQRVKGVQRALARNAAEAHLYPATLAITAARWAQAQPAPRHPSPRAIARVTPRRVATAHGKLLDQPPGFIVVAGGLAPEALRSALPQIAGTPPGEQTASPTPTSRPPTGQAVLVHHPSGLRARVTVALPLPPHGDEGFPAGLIALEAIAGGFSSRVQRRLRQELGLVYAVDTRVHLTASPPWAEVSTSCHTDDLVAVLSSIDRELDDAGRPPLGPGEILAAARAVTTRARHRQASVSGAAQAALTGWKVARDPGWWTGVLAATANPDPAAVSDAARRLLEDRTRALVIVGDRRIIEPALELTPHEIDKIWDGRSLMEAMSAPP